MPINSRTGIIVNSLGEVCKDHECVCGTVYVDTAIQRYDPHLTHDRCKLGSEKFEKRRDAACRQMFHAQLHEECAYPVAQWIEHIWELQELNDGVARIWARDSRILMSVEIKERVEEKDWWARLYRTIKDNGWSSWVMIEQMENCTFKPKGAKKFIPVPDSNHGHVCRQVSIDMRVPDNASLKYARELKRKMIKVLKPFYKKAGVTVI